MTPDDARRALRRSLARDGEDIVLRRAVVNGAPIERTVRGRITGYSPAELASGIMQGNRKAIISAEDIEASGFPLPFKQGSTDSLVAHGATMKILSVDDSTKRIGSTLIAYVMGVAG